MIFVSIESVLNYSARFLTLYRSRSSISRRQNLSYAWPMATATHVHATPSLLLNPAPICCTPLGHVFEGLLQVPCLFLAWLHF